jgi:hypothetical protein
MRMTLYLLFLLKPLPPSNHEKTLDKPQWKGIPPDQDIVKVIKNKKSLSQLRGAREGTD